jgi:hypothetical protein
MNEWIACSHTALNTGVKMVVDIVETVIEKLETHTYRALATCYRYIVRAALQYIARRGSLWQEDAWSRGAEARLRSSMKHFAINSSIGAA